MNLVINRPGKVGGGLAAPSREARHDVTALGRGVVAVPGPAITATLGTVTGLTGKIAPDATNAFPSRNDAFPSLAEEVNSVTGAPVAKSFNLNFAVLYDQITAQRVPPGSFYVAGDGARHVTGQLITDADCDPVWLGGLGKARAVEDLAWLLAATVNDGVPVCCRFAVAGER